jgi:predicted MFS family arabinose efflux permease
LTAKSHDGFTSRPIALALILGIGMAVSTVAGTLVGVLGPYLQVEIGITPGRLGLLVTTFAICSAGFSWPGGLLTDSIGGRRTLLLVLSGSMVSMVVLASAFSYPWLLVAMGLAGLSNSSVNPATNRIIADSVVPGSRGIAAGLKMACVQLAVFAAGMLIPLAAEGLGWRVPLAITVVSISLVGIFGLLALTDPIRRATGATADRSRLKWSAELVTLTLYSFSMSAGASAILTYLPLYTVEALDSTARVGGLAVAVVGLLAIAGRLVLGRLTERIAIPMRALTAVGVLGVGSTLMILAVGSAGTPLYWFGVVGLGLSAQSFVAGTTVAVIVSVPREQVGGASGVIFLGFLVGFGVGPAAFGTTVEATGAYTTGWAMTVVAFGLATAFAAVPARQRR